MALWNGIELDDLVLTGERLTLRPWQPDDASDVVAIMAESAMHSFLPLPDPYTAEDARRFVTEFGVAGRRAGTGISNAMVETATGRLVGAAELRFPERRETSGEVGYWVSVPARGNGYAAEATRLLADWAFHHGVRRVELRCAVGNIASSKTALAAGFRFEGVTRGKEVTPRGREDGALFARLPRDDGKPVQPTFAPLPAGGLTNGTLALRGLTPADAAAVFEEASNTEAMRWSFSAAPPDRAGIDEAVAHAGLRWLVGPSATMAMIDIVSGEVAGIVSLRRSGPPQVGLVGYGVLPRFRGRGYTAQALRLLAEWAFQRGGFARLELGAKVANVASQKAALAGGFAPDGVREARLANPDGTFSDEARFALVNPRVTRADGPEQA